MARYFAVVLATFLCAEEVVAHGAVHERLAAVECRLADSPKDPSLLVQRAALFHEHGDHGKALDDLRAVGRIDPAFAERWLLEARIHSACGKPDQALAAVQSLLEKKPNSIEALSLRGQILEKLGRNEDAIRDARKVITLAPQPKLHQYMRLIQLLELHGNRAEVAAAFSAARKSLGSIPVLLQEHAAWLGATGDRKGAAAVYAELREKVPGLAFSLYVQEVRLWTGHDEERARSARNEAERAWSALSPTVRSRAAMHAMHREIQALKDPVPGS